jgi:uncharacterized protein YkwD
MSQIRWRTVLLGRALIDRLLVLLARSLPAILLAPLLGAVLLLSNPAPTTADPAIEPVEAEFLALINQYRAENGRGALVLHPNLNAAADWFAWDMAIDNYWGAGHWDNESPPRLPPDRAVAFGYPNRSVGENIAGGFQTAQAVFNAWRSSPGHNANMLHSSYRVIGIGRADRASSQFRYYWVTDFGFTLPPGGPVPTPTPPVTPTMAPTLPPTSPPTLPPTPTAAPTATPAPTPATEHMWGDIDCNGRVESLDASVLLAAAADIDRETAGAGCLAPGDAVTVGGIQRRWGDMDCAGSIGPGDPLLLLRYLSGLGWQPPAFACPPPGMVF